MIGDVVWETQLLCCGCVSDLGSAPRKPCFLTWVGCVTILQGHAEDTIAVGPRDCFTIIRRV